MTNLCIVCGGLHSYPNEKMCSQCKDTYLLDFQKIREYLSNQPNSNAIQVAEDTGISISRITKFIKIGALSTK